MRYNRRGVLVLPAGDRAKCLAFLQRLRFAHELQKTGAISILIRAFAFPSPFRDRAERAASRSAEVPA